MAAWEAEPSRSPFPLDAPGAQRAFLHGALAPDWGYVPGGDRFFSELTHYVDTADLTRSILAASHTVHDRAFAWGWVTHVLGDIAIHPLVGRACGEHLYGDRELRLNSSADVATHVAIEIGLDIVFLARGPSISPPPPDQYLYPENVGQLLSGLRQTYGLMWDPARLVGLHRRAARLTAGWRTALAIVANREGMRNGHSGRLGSRVVNVTIGTAARLVRPGTPISGFLSPIRPPAWLIDEVQEISLAFPSLVEEQVRTGLSGLANHNLESGVPDGTGVHHVDQEAARRKLRDARHRAAA